MKTLLTDVDDVLLNYMDSYKRYVEHCGYSFRYEEPVQWDLTHWVDGPWKELIKEFNSSKYFSQLEPFPDAVRAIKELKYEYKIIAISACSKDSRHLRERNLKDVFGDAISDIHLVDLGISKYEILSSMPKSIWVEDRMEGAIDGMLCGHNTFLMNRSHNLYQEHPEVKKVDSWDEILKLINPATFVNFNSSF